LEIEAVASGGGSVVGCRLLLLKQDDGIEIREPTLVVYLWLGADVFWNGGFAALVLKLTTFNHCVRDEHTEEVERYSAWSRCLPEAVSISFPIPVSPPGHFLSGQQDFVQFPVVTVRLAHMLLGNLYAGYPH